MTAAPPVHTSPLPAVLSRWAALRPDDTAFLFAGADLAVEHEVTYRELEQTARLAAVRLAAELPQGARVPLLCPPGPEYVVALLACMYAGLVAVPLYPPRPGAKLDRITSVVRDCAASHVLTTKAVAPLLDSSPAVGPDERPVVMTVEDLVTARPAPVAPRPAAPEDIAFLQYTSGSTGRPKGVVVTHRNLNANVAAIAAGFGLRDDDVVVSWLPMYHDMGLVGTTLLPLVLGLKVVLLNTFTFIHDPAVWLRAISRFGATCSGGPDFAYRLLVERHRPGSMDGVDLSRWRIAFNGAEPVSTRTMESFTRTYGAHGFRGEAFYPCYGLAEATLFVTGSRPGTGFHARRFDRAALERRRLEVHRSGAALASSGLLTDTIAIRDDRGGVADEGVVGEILVRGESVAAGYWQDEEATAEAFGHALPGLDGTYLRTGDLGAALDGHLYVVGRRKDLLIVGGRNIHPQDVEHAAVGAVTETRLGRAAAFQPDTGSPLVVLVVELARHEVGRLRRDREALLRMASTVRRQVAADCGLDLGEIVFVRPGGVPTTSSGKVRRSETRDRLANGTLALIQRVGASDSGPAPVVAHPAALPPAVSQAVATVLGVPLTEDETGVPLAALGLDSLKLVALRDELERALGRRVDSALLFGDRSLNEVVRALESTPVPSAADVPPTGPVHATEGQVQMRFHQQLFPEDSANNLPCALRMDRRIEPGRFRRAVAAAVERHPGVRFALGRPGGPLREAPPGGRFDWHHVELDSDDPATARDVLAEIAFRPFDLASGPLVRAALVTAPGTSTFLLACHHVAVDYWSLRILFAEILSDVLRTGTARPSGSATALDFAREQHHAARSGDFAAPLAALTEKWRPLRNALLFPSAHRSTVRRNPAGVLDFALPAEPTTGLSKHARARGVTPFTGITTAYLRALHRVTGGREQIVVGTPHHGRTGARFEGAVGYFVNLLPLLGDFSAGDDLSELELRTWRELRAAQATATVPFSRLVRELAPDRHGQNPLFQATVTFQQSADGLFGDGFAIPWTRARQEVAGVTVEAFDIPPRDAAFAISLYGAPDGDRTAFRLVHQRDLVGPGTAVSVRDEFLLALHELVTTADPTTTETRGR